MRKIEIFKVAGGVGLTLLGLIWYFWPLVVLIFPPMETGTAFFLGKVPVSGYGLVVVIIPALVVFFDLFAGTAFVMDFVAKRRGVIASKKPAMFFLCVWVGALVAGLVLTFGGFYSTGNSSGNWLLSALMAVIVMGNRICLDVFFGVVILRLIVGNFGHKKEGKVEGEK